MRRAWDLLVTWGGSALIALFFLVVALAILADLGDIAGDILG